MATVCTVTSPAVLQSSAGVTGGQWDTKAQTCYQSKCVSSRELPGGESELPVHKALSLSFFLSLCLRLSQGPFELFPDHQTELFMSVINTSR